MKLPRHICMSIQINPHRVMGVPDGATLVFLGTAVSGNTGRVAHLYEIKAVS